MSGRQGISWAGVLIGLVIVAAAGVAAFVTISANKTGRGGSRLGPSYGYDLGKLRRVDPKLILYEEDGPAGIATGFAEARAIAVGPGDAVYVAGDTSVRVFDARGAVACDVGLPGPPRCLTVDADGTIYAGLKDHVEVLDANGTGRTAWPAAGENAVLTSIAVAGTDVFVADAGSRVVLRYDKAGKLLGRIGRKDPNRNIPGFVVPSPYFDLAMAPDGLLRVTNPGRHRIEAYTLDGDLELAWGTPSATNIEGFAGCCNPVNFAIGPGGEFITCEKGLTRVKVYDAEGVFRGVVASPAQFARHDRILSARAPSPGESTALDVAIDSRSRVLVLDPCTGEVRVFVRKRPSRPDGGGE